jgi:hypothetical protein
VDIFRVQQDGSEDLVASGLHPAEVDGLREWFCYTKPIGRGVRIVVRPTYEGDSEFSVLAAGTEPEPPENEFARAATFPAGSAAMCDCAPRNGTAAALQGW